MIPIVGIVKDFHYASLREAIGPLAIMFSTDRVVSLSLKTDGEDVAGTIAFIEETYKTFEPYRSFTYTFADDNFNENYRYEEKLSKIVTAFAGIAVFVACLGLFGLASFNAEQHTKEIGIRKVLGASISGIVILLSKGITRWVVIANLISFPAIFIFTQKFLQTYAYKMKIGFELFIVPGLIALAIAIITVSYQTIRAATANPVESLRYE
jgi:putative ABC transport system permease protein